MKATHKPFLVALLLGLGACASDAPAVPDAAPPSPDAPIIDTPVTVDAMPPVDADPRVPIWIIAGQSNAEGRGNVTEVANYQELGLENPYPQVVYYEQIADSVLDPLVWRVDRGPVPMQPQFDIFGVELSFGRHLTDLGVTHVLSKTAVGGASLAVHWDPSGSYPSNPPTLYARMVALAERVELEQHGHVVGVIWIQGESDASNLDQANAYAANEETLIATIRQIWPDSFFLFTRLHVHSSVPYDALLRSQQAMVAAATPRTRLIDVDDLPIFGQHFTSQGYYDLGIRLADAAYAVEHP